MATKTIQEQHYVLLMLLVGAWHEGMKVFAPEVIPCEYELDHITRAAMCSRPDLFGQLAEWTSPSQAQREIVRRRLRSLIDRGLAEKGVSAWNKASYRATKLAVTQCEAAYTATALGLAFVAHK